MSPLSYEHRDPYSCAFKNCRYAYSIASAGSSPDFPPTLVFAFVLHKVNHRFTVFEGEVSQAAHELEEHGYVLVKNMFTASEIDELREDIEKVFRKVPADQRAGRETRKHAEMFRYQMFNRSEVSQRIIADPRMLEIVDPLLGPDCHIIAHTAWRNFADPEFAPNGQEWHTDGGPHVPRSPDVDWPDDIPYPVFAIATHIFLLDVTLDDGPTAVVPGSHKSGLAPPFDARWDLELSYRDRASSTCTAQSGDVAFFVSDVWHRRLPPRTGGQGRFFLQSNYARRDIAQRVLPTAEVNHTSKAARKRARTAREQRLIGLHPEMFYDG